MAGQGGRPSTSKSKQPWPWRNPRRAARPVPKCSRPRAVSSERVLVTSSKRSTGDKTRGNTLGITKVLMVPLMQPTLSLAPLARGPAGSMMEGLLATLDHQAFSPGRKQPNPEEHLRVQARMFSIRALGPLKCIQIILSFPKPPGSREASNLWLRPWVQRLSQGFGARGPRIQILTPHSTTY